MPENVMVLAVAGVALAAISALAWLVYWALFGRDAY
jgi:hypothetical protein